MNKRDEFPDFVPGMWAAAHRKAAGEQMAQWREFHAHCGHARDMQTSILCDITEAYVTYTEEIRSKAQREAWRASEPLVRSDATRLVRDHHFALEMDVALSAAVSA